MLLSKKIKNESFAGHVTKSQVSYNRKHNNGCDIDKRNSKDRVCTYTGGIFLVAKNTLTASCVSSLRVK